MAECSIETHAPMVNNTLNNAVFRSIPRITQSLYQILHVLHFCTVNSLLNYASDFVVNWTEVRAVQRP